MAATDALQLPLERKDAIKVALLELHKVQSIDIARLAEASAKIDSSALDDILQSPDPKPVDVFNAMRPMTIAMRTAIDAMLAGGEALRVARRAVDFDQRPERVFALPDAEALL